MTIPGTLIRAPAGIAGERHADQRRDGGFRHRLDEAVPGETPALVRPVIRAEFFTRTGLDILVAHTGLAPPLRGAAEAYL
jgi:hypothetical protein